MQRVTLNVEVTGVDDETLSGFASLLLEELRGQIEGNYTLTDTDGTEQTVTVSVVA